MLVGFYGIAKGSMYCLHRNFFVFFFYAYGQIIAVFLHKLGRQGTFPYYMCYLLIRYGDFQ